VIVSRFVSLHASRASARKRTYAPAETNAEIITLRNMKARGHADRDARQQSADPSRMRHLFFQWSAAVAGPGRAVKPGSTSSLALYRL
jgi:hypothetical protein